ncbi:hypothetical protein [Rhodoplanes sp. Z2-YC6860]|uniref:hypothetical protein n=1 Tax=Rhodoplanes sp. Z2-YC6860 TaxID=674703 RepID=UPI00078C9213|nr:hypothetical protein [Rhodoplanes sp. Z2-YC6860]AMN41945.1 hypothetical protein RHPLAN_35130 [Rhodoplanes sp. Z2-YC6860]
MQILSKDETSQWCQRHSVALDVFGCPEHADCPVKFRIPEDAGKRVYLVAQAMRAFSDESRMLVWFTEWGIWPSGERRHVFDRFRLSYGEKRLLIDSLGHVFGPGEFEDAVSFVTLAVLFLWDCNVVTPHRSKLLFLSHDEWGAATGVDVTLGAPSGPH